MVGARYLAVAAAVLWLSAAAVGQEELRLTVSLDPEAPVPPVATVPQGAHVRLTVLGAGDAELHLHGYDVEARGGVTGGDRPPVLAFEATHEGRFPVEAHVEDALLGAHGRPVLFVEVRGP